MIHASKFWNLSNLITSIRLFCLIPFIYFYERGDYWESISFLALGMLTDFLDGYVARLMNQVSDLGKILDPVIDKICLGVIAYYLWTKDIVPLWPFVLLVVRDGFILFGGKYLMKKKNIILTSLMLGKFAVTFLAFGFLFSIIPLDWISEVAIILIYLGGAFLVISFVQYAVRFFQYLRPTMDAC